MNHICERCGSNFEYGGNVKRCSACRVSCEKCGRPTTHRAKLCGRCRKLNPKRVKCLHPDCDKFILYAKIGLGFCMKHTDYSKHAKRITEYNKTIKKKPEGTKYKTARIPSVKTICRVCGNEFLARPDAIRTSKTGLITCSRRCQGIRAAKLTPKKRTSIEIAIEKELIRRGEEFIEQHPLCGITLVDFYLPRKNIVIYCDGNYWHSTQKRKETDRNQNITLERNGYKVFRFTETEIKQSPLSCVERIYQ